ncbi:MAG TPA: cytochrome c [Burkholderiales bacterium]|nr:cytochrome c [Burkholderiales bacterium]
MWKAAVGWCGAALACAAGGAAAEPPAPARQLELARLVRQDCGSCHGLTLQGGLGPPLTAAALRGKSAEYLRLTILHGRPGTPMPPWRALLTESEAAWIAEQLLKGLTEPGSGPRGNRDDRQRRG